MLEKIRDFIRHSHVYTKAAYIAAIVVTIIFGLGITLLFPHADANSIQAGLAIIAEILGVLLGVVLVIVGLLVQQEQQSEALLRDAYPKYYKLIKSHLRQVNSGRQRLINFVRAKQIKLSDPILPPLATTYSDVLGCFVSLSIIFGLTDTDESKKTLEQLGFKKKDIDNVLFGQGVLGNYDPPLFLTLVKGAFNIVVLLGSEDVEDVSDLSSNLLVDYSRDGIDKALERLEMSRKFLKSKYLAFSIALLATTTIGAVVALFGTTEKTVTDPVLSGVVIAVIVGFYLSILLTLFLVKKLFV
jgi:hypothetical protein